MSGCFGGSAEDRYFESQLNKYLDSLEEYTEEEIEEIERNETRKEAAYEDYWEARRERENEQD